MSFVQVYTFGGNTSCCCGVGESGQAILKPTCVTSLQGIPCQQVSAGNGFTLAVTSAGKYTRGGVATVVNSALATLKRALGTNSDLG